MDTKAARRVKVGDRVTWHDPAEMTFTTTKAIAASFGTVTEKGYSAFKVEWDDGMVVAYQFVHASHIHLAQSPKPKDSTMSLGMLGPLP